MAIRQMGVTVTIHDVAELLRAKCTEVLGYEPEFCIVKSYNKNAITINFNHKGSEEHEWIQGEAFRHISKKDE